MAGTSTGGEGSRPLKVAITRTGAPASPASAARSSAWPGSCEVEGATSTTGLSPGSGATRSPGGSHGNGPVT